MSASILGYAGAGWSATLASQVNKPADTDARASRDAGYISAAKSDGACAAFSPPTHKMYVRTRVTEYAKRHGTMADVAQAHNIHVEVERRVRKFLVKGPHVGELVFGKKLAAAAGLQDVRMDMVPLIYTNTYLPARRDAANWTVRAAPNSDSASARQASEKAAATAKALAQAARKKAAAAEASRRAAEESRRQAELFAAEQAEAARAAKAAAAAEQRARKAADRKLAAHRAHIAKLQQEQEAERARMQQAARASAKRQAARVHAAQKASVAKLRMLAARQASIEEEQRRLARDEAVANSLRLQQQREMEEKEERLKARERELANAKRRNTIKAKEDAQKADSAELAKQDAEDAKLKAEADRQLQAASLRVRLKDATEKGRQEVIGRACFIVAAMFVVFYAASYGVAAAFWMIVGLPMLALRMVGWGIVAIATGAVLLFVMSHRNKRSFKAEVKEWGIIAPFVEAATGGNL